MGQAQPRRNRAVAPLVWILAAACLPDPQGATTATGGAETGGPGATTGDSGATTSHASATTSVPGMTTGGMSATTGDTVATTSDPGTTSSGSVGDSEDTVCEPSTGDPVCDVIPVTPGGDRGCGGEELSIVGCDQLAGYEICPDMAIHRHTASVPCDDDRLCDPLFSCHTDDDCGPKSACVCDVTWGDDHPSPGPFTRLSSCVWAQCRTDADCAFGMRCGVDTQCGYVNGLFCHTPEDGCEGDADCPEHCGYSPEEGRWFCVIDASCE